MVKRIFYSKIFVLFLCMILIGFIIGYTYSVFTSKAPAVNRESVPETHIQESQKENSDLE